MVSGIFHVGSGMGNQLHRYVATRVLALDKGYDFSMVAPENFKGTSFMDLDMGKQPNGLVYDTEFPSGKLTAFIKELNHVKAPLWEEKTSYYNPEFSFIEDNTIIDGEFQDERYFGHRLEEIDEWLKVDPIDIPDDVCVIGFRGGEFATVPELFLPYEYWRKAIDMMYEINPKMKFEIHTDDEVMAKHCFPGFKVIHDIGINWRSMRSAGYAIIANSSFYILPRLLRHSDIDPWTSESYRSLTIAPRYWARRNTKEWSMPQNYYKNFTYI